MVQKKCWMPIYVEHESRVKQIRDELYDYVGSDIYEKELNPHISLLPGFKIDDVYLPEVHETLNQQNLRQKPVSITGFDIYPSVENPMVVTLDVNMNLESAREALAETIRENGGELLLEPKSPHLTLFKGGNSGEENTWSGLSASEKENLKDALDQYEPLSFSTLVSDITVERFSDE